MADFPIRTRAQFHEMTASERALRADIAALESIAARYPARGGVANGYINECIIEAVKELRTLADQETAELDRYEAEGPASDDGEMPAARHEYAAYPGRW